MVGERSEHYWKARSSTQQWPAIVLLARLASETGQRAFRRSQVAKTRLAVAQGAGAAGGCRLLVLCVYVLVLRGVAVCLCRGSIYWCCGGLPSVGAVVLSTGAVGLPTVDAVGVWSNWLHLTTSSAVLLVCWWCRSKDWLE